MAKDKEVKEEKQSDRELRWAAFLEAHKKQNPKKHEERLAKGELDTIPDSFL